MAIVTDLMDRSRISAVIDGVEFVRTTSAVAGHEPDVVVADLRLVPDPQVLRDAAPRARIIAFGAHVDDAALDRGREAGLDEVLARSVFFRRLGELLP